MKRLMNTKQEEDNTKLVLIKEIIGNGNIKLTKLTINTTEEFCIAIIHEDEQ